MPWELGIDIGDLDAALIVGYPGSISSMWQQAGRAGRQSEESLVVFVAHNAPIDQFLMRDPAYFFGQSPEHATIDPNNPHLGRGTSAMCFARIARARRRRRSNGRIYRCATRDSIR